jgi:hypothetical protein
VAKSKAKLATHAISPYRVFVSHSGDDLLVAAQIARGIGDSGASSFLDVRDIAKGDNFKSRIREEMPKCHELLALFTPWSLRRFWVRHEIGMADGLGLRIVCIFYNVSKEDFSQADGGLGPLDDLNIVDINRLDQYFLELRERAKVRHA